MLVDCGNIQVKVRLLYLLHKNLTPAFGARSIIRLCLIRFVVFPFFFSFDLHPNHFEPVL